MKRYIFKYKNSFLFIVHRMNTQDLVQFNWKNIGSQEEPILITIDLDSSVVPDPATDLTGIFDCCKQKLKDKRIGFFLEL